MELFKKIIATLFVLVAFTVMGGYSSRYLADDNGPVRTLAAMFLMLITVSFLYALSLIWPIKDASEG